MDQLKLLIVDDELGMRKGAQKALRNFEIRLPDMDVHAELVSETAADGAEAMKQFREWLPDLVLLDYKLPDVSGLDLLQDMRQMNGSDCRIIMITAFASLEVAVSATKNGAFDFLAKPFTPEELEDVVQKAAESLLHERQARALAEEKRKIRFQFLSVLAHELKAPLGSVESYLKIMRQHLKGEEVVSYDDVLDRSLLRLEGMRKMIEDLLDLTRIESGERQREIEPVDIKELVEGCVETFSGAAAARGIRFEMDVSADLVVPGDHSELEIVLNNLVSNAVKYNRDNGMVRVTATKGADGAVLRVADTGIGLSDEEQQRLFGEFVRIRNEKTRLIPGSGLGLSTVRKIISLYGGRIDVRSVPGEGSTFTVVLPY
jgi:signal transduction histidine kinase